MTLRRSIQPPPDAPFQVPLGPARFYLDEIRDVYNALEEFSEEYANQEAPAIKPGTVEIRALTAIADDFEDLKEATATELKNVTLILSIPKIRINLWNHNAAIIAESESPKVAAFAERIRTFTVSRRNWWVPWHFGALLSIIPNWFLAIACYFAPYYPSSWGVYVNRGIGRYTTATAVILTVMSAVVTIIVYARFIETIKIVPVWRKEQRGISAQTRTAIIVGITCAVVAGIISFWAGVFVHN